MDTVTSRYSTAYLSNLSNNSSVDDYVKVIIDLESDTVRPNITDSELLESKLGPRYRSLGEQILLTVVYSSIFLTGVIGNICTCIVICKNRYMHTATNYYLFSLAISDVLTLILGLPPELFAVWEAYPWRFGQPYCLFKVFLTEMTSSASILTITAFTVERYVAICHPMRAQRMSSLPRALKIVFLIWFCAALAALPYPVYTRTYYAARNPYTHLPIEESLVCNIPLRWRSIMRVAFQFSTFLLFVFPMTVITVLYLMIGLALSRANMMRNNSKEGQHCARNSGKIPNMLVAVVVAFFICWAPFHAQRLMTIYIHEEDWTVTLMEIQNILWYISGVFYFVSSTVNPILYNLMSRKYRQAFKETICTCCFKRSRDPHANGYTTYTFYSSSAKKHSPRTTPGGHTLYSQISVDSSHPITPDETRLGSNNYTRVNGHLHHVDINGPDTDNLRSGEQYEMVPLKPGKTVTFKSSA